MRYNDLEVELKRVCAEHRGLVRLSTLGKTPQGRDIHLLEIGPDPDGARPAVCVTAGLHGQETIGTRAAMSAVEELIAFFRGSGRLARDLSQTRARAVADTLFYVVPMISPDGVEAVASGTCLSRSTPHPAVGAIPRARWRRHDLDGDGAVRQIRLLDPAGEFVTHPRHPHVLVPRTIDDDGPFYKVYPEGIIDSFDGAFIPAGGANPLTADFNRSFPFGFDSATGGAAGFPGTDLEMRAVMEFAQRAPHIFAWLDLHSFGGIMLRPPFSRDTDLSAGDQASYAAIGAELQRLTGVPAVSALDQMTPDRNKPMNGTLCAWAHHDRASMAFVYELWDIFTAAGIERRSPFYRSYAAQSRVDVSKLVEWDERDNGGRAFAPWRAFDHPQLGAIEIGGIDPVIGFFNPPERHVADVVRAVAPAVAALAGFRPSIDMRVTADAIASGLTRLRLEISNSGYLPTSVAALARTQHWNIGIRASITTEGCRVVAGAREVDLGHLPGWGRGNEHEANGHFFQGSDETRRYHAEWILSGEGSATIATTSPRLGRRVMRQAIGA